MQIKDYRKIGKSLARFSIVTQEGIEIKGFTWNAATESLCGPRVKLHNLHQGGGWYYIVSLTKEQWQQLRQQLEQLPQQSP